MLADALGGVRASDDSWQPFLLVLSVAAIHTLVVAIGLIGQTWPSRCHPVSGPLIARL